MSKTTKIHSLTDMEARSQKMSAGIPPAETVGKNLLLASYSYKWLQAGILWITSTSLQYLLPSLHHLLFRISVCMHVCMLVSLSLSLIRILVEAFRTHTNNPG
jgi:hypothetical protein